MNEFSVAERDNTVITFEQHTLLQQKRYPGASGSFAWLLSGLTLATKIIQAKVRRAGLTDVLGEAGATNVQGENQQKLDVFANNVLLHYLGLRDSVGILASEENEEPFVLKQSADAKYIVIFDPLDGSSNIDVNVSVGSIFSILRAPQTVIDSGRDVVEADFLQPGSAQVAAGYALYGPTTMFVLSVGNGVAGFTLNPNLGEFMLTHPAIRVPEETREFAINASNARFWEPPVKRYVDECLAGASGPRGRDFNMRWIASMVAEAHRILMRGGVFLYPRDTRDTGRPGRLRLLYEANPVGFLIEQAGGRASTGRQPVLGVAPSALHQRIGLVFGSRHEVERIERYHHEAPSRTPAPPLFAERSLFRD